MGVKYANFQEWSDNTVLKVLFYHQFLYSGFFIYKKTLVAALEISL